ncbi:hypothetical protein SEA_ANDRIS_76 [Streptomyces phage Andris]|nr:hypothetical protein SEA_ANDRIS_76 [Streptomyces phage Andris]
MSAVPEDLAFALEGLAETFSFYGTAEAGPHFTCTEADSIARVLLASGNRDEAITWLTGHAHGDEWGDDHFIGDADDPEDEGRAMTDAELAAYVDELV